MECPPHQKPVQSALTGHFILSSWQPLVNFVSKKKDIEIQERLSDSSKVTPLIFRA